MSMQSLWMRRMALAALTMSVGLGAGVLGCSQLLTFPVDVTGEATVPGDPLAGFLGSVAFPELTTFDISESTEFENQGVAKEDVDSVILTGLSLKVLSPEGE